ncbi:hypothetical protein ACFQS7_07720 [Dankookia sp. GCM10030260]|uniref:hypothetical protein n=1 Tax=Dankookia sp. GCM10030260 TaxID=3273390 RepID=UPI00361D6BF4
MALSRKPPVIWLAPPPVAPLCPPHALAVHRVDRAALGLDAEDGEDAFAGTSQQAGWTKAATPVSTSASGVKRHLLSTGIANACGLITCPLL